MMPEIRLEEEFELVRYRCALEQRLAELPKGEREGYLLTLIQEMHRDFLCYQKQVAELYRSLSGI